MPQLYVGWSCVQKQNIIKQVIRGYIDLIVDLTKIFKCLWIFSLNFICVYPMKKLQQFLKTVR